MTLVSDVQTTVNTSGYTQLGNTFRFAIIDAKNVRYLWKAALLLLLLLVDKHAILLHH